jgi:hypothetical protein
MKVDGEKKEMPKIENKENSGTICKRIEREGLG